MPVTNTPPELLCAGEQTTPARERRRCCECPYRKAGVIAASLAMHLDRR